MERFQVRMVSSFESLVVSAAADFPTAMQRARQHLHLGAGGYVVEIWEGGRRICGVDNDGYYTL